MINLSSNNDQDLMPQPAFLLKKNLIVDNNFAVGSEHDEASEFVY